MAGIDKKLPVLEAPVAVTKTLLGATWWLAVSIWDFPNPGSPTIRIWGSPRTATLSLSLENFEVPPNKAKSNPALTISCP